jgi:hypothetical protein
MNHAIPETAKQKKFNTRLTVNFIESNIQNVNVLNCDNCDSHDVLMFKHNRNIWMPCCGLPALHQHCTFKGCCSMILQQQQQQLLPPA